MREKNREMVGLEKNWKRVGESGELEDYGKVVGELADGCAAKVG
jgi:hypothetical protein